MSETFKTGEKPGAGLYICLVCGKTIRLEHGGEPLPPCPICGAEVYRKQEE